MKLSVKILLFSLLVLTTVVIVSIYQRGAAAERNRLPELYTLGGDFVLPSTLGRELDTRSLRGKLILLNFGYTSCPDVCPTVLSRMRNVLQALPQQRDMIAPVFVTLDPERDSLAVLSPYLAYFDAQFIGMRGSQEQTQSVSEMFKVFSEKVPGTDDFYSVDHSDGIFLIDQSGMVRATFGGSALVERMAADIERLLREG